MLKCILAGNQKLPLWLIFKYNSAAKRQSKFWEFHQKSANSYEKEQRSSKSYTSSHQKGITCRLKWTGKCSAFGKSFCEEFKVHNYSSKAHPLTSSDFRDLSGTICMLRANSWFSKILEKMLKLVSIYILQCCWKKTHRCMFALGHRSVLFTHFSGVSASGKQINLSNLWIRSTHQMVIQTQEGITRAHSLKPWAGENAL